MQQLPMLYFIADALCPTARVSRGRSQGAEGSRVPRVTLVPPPSRRFLLNSGVEASSPNFLLDTPHFCHPHFFTTSFS